MAYMKISVSVEEAQLEQLDAIREAMGEANPYGAKPTRSGMIQDCIDEIIDEHRDLLDDEGAGMGNPLPIQIS